MWPTFLDIAPLGIQFILGGGLIMFWYAYNFGNLKIVENVPMVSMEKRTYQKTLEIPCFEI